MSDHDKDELEVYKSVNEDLKRFYDYIVDAFEHVKNKALALLVGEIAIATFLFSGFHFKVSPTPPIYGIVLFSIGIAFLVLAFAMYLIVIATAQWYYPTEEHDMKNPTDRFNGDPLKYQMYAHEEYMKKIAICNSKLRYRSIRFMYGTYALSAGVFIILLVKYGGGAT